MKTESGLVAVAEVGSGFSLRWTEPDYGCSCKTYDKLVRLSDAEAIIAKLRDALSETEAYHKRTVAAKDAEIERLKNDLADALDMKVGKGPTALSWQADRIEKQSAALKLAKEALERSSKRDIAQWHNWDWDGDDDGKTPTQLNDPVLQVQLKALAAINEVLGE